MGKSEVNPLAPEESSGSSGSDFEVLDETTRTCDGQDVGATGGDEGKQGMCCSCTNYSIETKQTLLATV